MTANLVPLPTVGQRPTREQLELIKRTLMPRGSTDDELSLFVGTANRMGLDPSAQQIRAIRRQEYNADTRQMESKISIEVGIDGFRLIAARTKELEGRLGPFWCGPDGKWVDAWLSDSPPAAARVGVLRRGFREPLWAVALWREYAARKRDGSVTRMWSDRPAGQLAKCAEALALRAAFPYELGGTYTTDEMAQADRDEPEATISRFAVVEGGIPSEDTIRGLESVAAAKELVTREIVSDRYREAVKVAEVDLFGEVWEDFWRAADLKSWVEILLAARLAVAPRAIEQTSDPAPHSPPRATGSDPTSSESAARAVRQIADSEDDQSPEPNPAPTAVAGSGGPRPSPSTSPEGEGPKAGRGRRGGRVAPGSVDAADPPPAGPDAEQAEQVAFEQTLTDDDAGRFAR
jgi:phage recombination protein Bet